MKAQRYKEIAGGAVVRALADAGDKLGEIESVKVDGVEMDAAGARNVETSERAAENNNPRGGDHAT